MNGEYPPKIDALPKTHVEIDENLGNLIFIRKCGEGGC